MLFEKIIRLIGPWILDIINKVLKPTKTPPPLATALEIEALVGTLIKTFGLIDRMNLHLVKRAEAWNPEDSAEVEAFLDEGHKYVAVWKSTLALLKEQ